MAKRVSLASEPFEKLAQWCSADEPVLRSSFPDRPMVVSSFPDRPMVVSPCARPSGWPSWLSSGASGGEQPQS
jgi:hypothetical protein